MVTAAPTTATALDRLLSGSPYRDYLYSYPHKTAYRALAPPVPLDALWAEQPRDALFLYIHVPFCAARCGYCNLFSRANPRPELVQGWLDALERQARAVTAALGQACFARFALGGGTPSVLDAADLARVFDLVQDVLGATPAQIPASVEVSPTSVDDEKLALLRRRGVDRISVGVQSFVEPELRALQRSGQRTARVEATLTAVKELGFSTLNVDLIYGIEGQTAASWRQSLEQALRFSPEELYLYPLYVRPLTGLGQGAAAPPAAWDEQRLTLYRAGRELLRAAGYRQVSMRMFRREGDAEGEAQVEAPLYRCQEDGMVGLSCGARSYTERLHYSSDYAVGGRSVLALIEAYNRTNHAAFSRAEHGIRLDDEDLRRRHVILSLLLAPGLDLPAYTARFGGDALGDLPQLAELEPRGLAHRRGGRLALSARGMELSDLLGPWLRSARVEARMRAYEQR
jgi:oxygen-independent coproporphyrinogen III oxidase